MGRVAVDEGPARDTYSSIQYLRGIAALAIVMKHASHPGGPIQNALDGGVDLFFMISGFVMVVSTHGRDLGPAIFLAKRARRILPMWWITLAIVAALGLGQGAFSNWIESALLYPSFLAYGVGSVSWGLGWTLVFEVIFYLLFAIGLGLKWDRFVYCAIPALVLTGIVFGRGDAPVINTLLHPLLLEFLMGVILARLAISNALPPLFLTIIGMSWYAVASMVPITAYDFRPLFKGAPLILVVAGIVGLEQRSLLPNMPVLRYLGDASYSIYLLHYVAIMLAWSVIPKGSLWPVTAGLGILIGCLAYSYVERPLLTALRRRHLLDWWARKISRPS